MGWMTGMVSGFLGEKQRMEMENRRQAELASANEAEVYKTLLNSPNPDIRAKAITGMLESARGPQKAGGIRGWLGQMEQSPLYGQMQSLIRSTSATHQAAVDEAGQAGQAGPPEPTGGALSQVPSGSLAQPATAATQGGPMAQPLPAPASREEAASTSTLVAAPPPQLQVPEVPVTSGIPAAVGAPPPQAQAARRKAIPPPVFYSPQEAAGALTAEQIQGRVDGILNAYEAHGGVVTPEFAKQVALEVAGFSSGGSGGADRQIFGDILQPDGTWTAGSVIFDPQSGTQLDSRTHQPVLNFRRSATTGSASNPTDARRLMQQLFPGKRLDELTGEEAAQLNTEVVKYGGMKAHATVAARLDELSKGPISTEKRLDTALNLQKMWMAENAATREMGRQLQLMNTGVARYGQGDRIGGSQAVLVTFQKILDPSSVVRESEYDRSGASLGLKDRMQGLYDRYVGQWDPVKQQWVGGGAGVPIAELREMAETARQFVENMANYSGGVKQQLYQFGSKHGITPDEIFRPEDMLPEWGAPPTDSAASSSPASPLVGQSPAAATSPLSQMRMRKVGNDWVLEYWDPTTKQWGAR